MIVAEQLYPDIGLRLMVFVVMFFLFAILGTLLYFKMKEKDEKAGIDK